MPRQGFEESPVDDGSTVVTPLLSEDDGVSAEGWNLKKVD